MGLQEFAWLDPEDCARLQDWRCCVLSSPHKKNSVKWFEMFDKLITKPSNEGFASLPFQGLESGGQPSTLPFVSDSGHISKRKLLTEGPD